MNTNKMICLTFAALLCNASYADIVKGDFRVKNTTTTIDEVSQNETKLRARLEAVGDISSSLNYDVRLSSTDKVDLANIIWNPIPKTKVTLGKMKQPWLKTESLYIDNDINPIGLAISQQLPYTGFVNVYSLKMPTDSIMSGIQVGVQPKFGDYQFTVAGSYTDNNGIRGKEYSGSNTLNFNDFTNFKLNYDYDIAEFQASVETTIFDQPVKVYADLVQNMKATKEYGYGYHNNVYTNYIPAIQDRAQTFGITVGEAKNPGTVEIGFLYQDIGKDALYDKFIDSDVAFGKTETIGWVHRGSYQVTKHARLNGSYYYDNDNSEHLSVDLTIMF